MKLSLEWLNEYVDLYDIDPQYIANELTMKTAEVESLSNINYCLDKVVIGEVVESKPIKEQSGLYLLQVWIGNEIVQVICSASNIRVGMKSLFAPLGAVLNTGAQVEKVIISGCESMGRLLSAKEIGLGSCYDMVIDLPSNLSSGKLIKELVPSRDYLIEIDNKSITNRPDLWGHYGFARELSAIFGRELNTLNQVDYRKFDKIPSLPIIIDNYDFCPGYSCLLIEKLGFIPSSLKVQWRLYSIGLRSINSLVDLTNYIMYEIGHPIHVFDADFFNVIRIGMLGKNEDFISLDGQSRRILADDLMIWNEREPVALAGIIGGLNSEVTLSTNRVLLESAVFQPEIVRRTSMRLGLRTDASQRFEKGLPISYMFLSIGRFLFLAREEIGYFPVVTSSFFYADYLTYKSRYLKMPISYIPDYLGVDISHKHINSILRSVGFDCIFELNQMVVTIPDYRSSRDISGPQDIVEEVARFYGYDNIKSELPLIQISDRSSIDNVLLTAEHKIRKFLSQAYFFNEVYNYSWYDDRWLAQIDFNPGLTVNLINPIAPYKARLRNFLLPNLLKVIDKNYIHRDELKIFEVGRVYRLDKNKCYESVCICAVFFRSGRQEDNLQFIFLKMKGILEDLALLLGTRGFNFKKEKRNSIFWPIQAGTYLEIWGNGRRQGTLGYLYKSMLETGGRWFKRSGQIAWLELELDQLVLLPYPEIKFDLSVNFSQTWLDFSILWPVNDNFSELVKKLDSFKDKYIRRRLFLGYYVGPEISEDVRSYTFRYYIGIENEVLTRSDIDKIKRNFLSFLHKEGIFIR